MSASRDIVLFSTADWFTPYWTNKQHTAEALAAAGHRVLYVETPGIRQPALGDRRDLGRLARRLMTGLRGLVAGPQPVRDGVWVLSPLSLPWGRNLPAVQWLNGTLLRWSLGRFAGRHGFGRPEIWTYHPYMLDAIAGLAHGPLSYHCVDDISAVPGVDAEAFRVAEDQLLVSADVVFVTARSLEARCRQLNDNVIFHPNVADAEHFGHAFAGEVAGDIAALPRPRLGYHGVLSDFKVDTDLLEAVARARPDWEIVLIGDEREGQSPASFAGLRGLRNVHFMGARDYAELPLYLAGIDVGLLPTLRNAYTEAMYPMKYFEYLAAGVPVVSTDLPFARDAGGFIEIGSDAEAFAAAVERQLARGRLTPAEARAGVGENTWGARLDRMLEATAATGRR